MTWLSNLCFLSHLGTKGQLTRYLNTCLFIKRKVSPLPNTTLKVSKTAPRSSTPGWGGFWTIDPQGHITIYVEEKLWQGCVNKGLLYEIVHTLQHEYVEAKLAIKMARKKFPDRNPYVMAEKDDVIGGLAHYEAIKELDGVSEDVYDKWLQKINRYLRS